MPPTLHYNTTSHLKKHLALSRRWCGHTLPYSEDDGDDTNRLKADGSFGFALQAGFDYWLNEHGVKLDVKKLWLDVDASINSGAITGEVELDPWIVGAGHFLPVLIIRTPPKSKPIFMMGFF